MSDLPRARHFDPVFNPGDYHFWQGAVPVIGLLTAVSPDTFTNDRGEALCHPTKKSPHVACTGSQDFYVEATQDGYFVNDLPVARRGDPTVHCGSAPPGQKGSILPLVSLDTFTGNG